MKRSAENNEASSSSSDQLRRKIYKQQQSLTEACAARARDLETPRGYSDSIRDDSGDASPSMTKTGGSITNNSSSGDNTSDNGNNCDSSNNNNNPKNSTLNTTNAASDSSVSSDGTPPYRQAKNFAERLMRVVQDGIAADSLWWVGNGKGVAIHKKNLRKSPVLASHFNIKDYNVFSRNLNRWYVVFFLSLCLSVSLSSAACCALMTHANPYLS